jgi:hypothetical protein
MRSSDIRDRSRSARARSTSLRVTSKQLRESVKALRAHRFQTDPGLPEQGTSSPRGFAVSIQQRVYKARHKAQALRRRAADLRNQAAAFRARR